VIIGTPGRINDALERHFTTLNQCQYVVLDEADTMIKEGFEEILNKILDQIPTDLKSENEKLAEVQEKESQQGIAKYRITMMFSATMTKELEKLARKYLRAPSYISIGEPGIGKKEIDQKVEYLGSESQKKEKLRNILNKAKPPIIIFVNRKTTADNLLKSLDRNFSAITLHGGKSQEGREKALNGFKDGKYDILITTNVAARGIDVENVKLVINYDAPFTIQDYNHRIGRTGRAGMHGTAITFLTNEDEGIFYDLVEYLIQNNQFVPPELASHPMSKIKPGQNKGQATLPKRRQIVYTA
jgi:ATP-dependent RNA helicase DDX23/PRP28